MDATVTFILFTSLIIMLSASGALFREQLQQSELLGIIVSSLVLLLSLKAGIAGLIKINSLLIPCLVIITCIVSVLAYFYPPSLYYPGDPLITNKFLIGGWAGAAILYVSYNILIAIVGLASLGSQVQQAKGSFGGFLGGLGVGCLAFIMGVAMMNFYPEILNYQIPMIFLAQYFHPVLKILETSALWIALLTTAAVDAYALATKIQKSSIFSYRFSLFGIIVFALPFSLMNFADLVSRVYPVLGYLGILIGSLILLRLVLRSKI